MQIPITCDCGKMTKTLFLRRIFVHAKDRIAKEEVEKLKDRCVFCSGRRMEAEMSASDMMQNIAAGSAKEKRRPKKRPAKD